MTDIGVDLPWVHESAASVSLAEVRPGFVECQAVYLMAESPPRQSTTYGTCRLVGDTWHIEAEPHVMVVGRRVLPCVSKRAVTTLKVSHTAANARDIEWFTQRYPLEVEPRDALERSARQHEENVLRMRDILAGHVAPREFDLKMTPRQYQAQATELYLASGQLLIGDFLGAGKTLMAVASFTDPRTLPAVVVAPAHLTRQWRRSIEKIAPTLNVHIVKKRDPYPLVSEGPQGKLFQGDGDAARQAGMTGPDVLIITYAKLAGWAKVLGEYCNSVVWEECHELRRRESQKWQAAEAIAKSVAFRLGLSATPVFNYGGELYNIMECLAPGHLGTLTEFKTAWCNEYAPDGKEKLKNPKAFGAYLRDEGLYIRRTREEVGQELPELTKITHVIDTDRKALDEVGKDAVRLADIILGNVETEDAQGKFRAGGELDWRLRQATGLAKAPHVAEFVAMLVENGEKVVLAGWHHAVYDVWMARFNRLGVKAVLYTGKVSGSGKDGAVKSFVDGDADVFIMSLRSGSGLDGLQEASSVVVYGELDWSPAMHDQLAGRLHRHGQHDPVTAYFLVSDEGSDPVVAEVLGLKREQAEGVMDPTGKEDFATAQTNGDHIRKLAEAWVARKAG